VLVKHFLTKFTQALRKTAFNNWKHCSFGDITGGLEDIGGDYTRTRSKFD
jgi:hypothetical protein